MESLEQSIEAYELQLKQVKDALLASGGDASQNGDLISLKTDLDQLIALTKQNESQVIQEASQAQKKNYNQSVHKGERIQRRVRSRRTQPTWNLA